jgi:ABC-type antimicrobial peptide transport system permease subunit
MYIIIRNLYRNKYKSIITLSICICLVLFLNVYIGNIDSNERQLESLPDAVPIYCRITNLNGNREAGLNIPGELVKKLQQSPYVKEDAYTVRMMGGIGEFAIEDWKENRNLNIIGANSVNAIPGFTSENIQMNMDEQNTFFSSSRAECIVSNSLIKEKGWKIGDTISLNLYFYTYDEMEGINCTPLELIPVKIVGEMNPSFTATEQAAPDILLPMETVMESYTRMQVPFSVDSASFYVSNPLKLNEFKEEMKSFDLMSKVASANDSYKGNALTVRDTIFISLSSQLQQTIIMLKSFFLMIGITIFIIGYIVSFLLIGSRQKEFSLMRTLGISVRGCIKVLWTEQFFLIITGEFIGSIMCINFQSIRTILITDALLLVIYLFGVLVALWRLGRKNTIQLLFMAD